MRSDLASGTGRDQPTPSRTTVFVGLLDWKSDEPPTAEAISRCEKYVRHFCVHLRAITAFGWTIDGWAVLGDPDFPEMIGVPGAGARVYRGGTYIRHATPEDDARLDHIPMVSWYATWLSANWHVGGTPNKIASPLMTKRFDEVKAKRAAEKAAKANKT